MNSRRTGAERGLPLRPGIWKARRKASQSSARVARLSRLCHGGAMLDHRAFLREPDQVLAGLRRRGVEASTIDRLTAHVSERRDCIQRVEGLRHQLKQASAGVQTKARAGDKEAVEEARARLKGLKAEINRGDETLTAAEESLQELLLTIPNLPHADVPDGEDESSNRTERTVGEPPVFDFPAKPHWELGETLGLFDFSLAAKLSGSRFTVYKGAGARLERALINFMLDLAGEHGYTEILPPVLVRTETMVGAGQYPKFEGESFETLDREFALIPTAEVPLVMMHRDEILAEEDLPARYSAYTPCFRREAGAAGRDTRGLIRLHQFNKVELVAYTTPNDSNTELERITQNAEEVLKRLELPYRVVTLCTGDLGFAAAKTYDLEVWLPGQDAYREISSCSNCTDFQARRAQIRYRPQNSGKKAKPALLHTLNGSGVAVGRTFVAILENGQQQDGSIRLPEAIVPYFGASIIPT